MYCQSVGFVCTPEIVAGCFGDAVLAGCIIAAEGWQACRQRLLLWVSACRMTSSTHVADDEAEHADLLRVALAGRAALQHRWLRVDAF
jgi:hypothetical protein